jgi:hypothetical protein
MRLLLLALPIFLLILSAISWGVRRFKEFALFEVQEVVVEGDVEIDFTELLGSSIFDLNREEIDAKCESQKVKLVNVKRLFPDRVMVEVKEREPFATLVLRRIYEIDAEGFILKGVDSKMKGAPLVRLFGLSEDATEEKAAQIWKLKSKRVMEIIHLFLERFGSVNEVRVYDEDLVIEAGLEQSLSSGFSRSKVIHLGQDQWTERLEKLIYINWKDLNEKEIDLRFKNQIIVKR